MSIGRRKQQEKQKKAEEERRLKEEADKLRQEEERAKQAAAQEAQRLNREKQQAAQRERQAALREEQEARARARAASEKAEAAAKMKATAKAEKANKALRAKENRDRERDGKVQKDKDKDMEKKVAGGSGDGELSIQEPGFGSGSALDRASVGEKPSQRVASRSLGGFGTGVSSPRSNTEEDAPSPTCPSTPLAGLSSLPLPPSMTSPSVGLQPASLGTASSGKLHVSPSPSTTTTGVTASSNGSVRSCSGNNNVSRSSGSGIAWSPKDLHRESVADAEGPLARLAIVGEEDATAKDCSSEKDDDVFRGLLHGVDPTEVNYTNESRVTSVGSGPNGSASGSHSSIHRNATWGSPERQAGSPRFDRAIGSMWDADPAPAPASSSVTGSTNLNGSSTASGSNSSTWSAGPSVGQSQLSAGLMPISSGDQGHHDQHSAASGSRAAGSSRVSTRAPRNAMETAAAWPTVALGAASRQVQGGSTDASSSQSQSRRRNLAGAPSITIGQSQMVPSWETGRLVGPSSPGSPDGGNTGGRDLGEEELPDWLLSTLGEMGGDGINMQESSKESDEPTSPVAQYLSQETPAGPRRSDLKLAGRRGPASPPHPALTGLRKTLAGGGDSGAGTGHAQQSVHWAPPGAFPPAPTVAGNDSLGANGWGVAASNSDDGNRNQAGESVGASSSTGWTVGTHRAKIV